MATAAPSGLGDRPCWLLLAEEKGDPPALKDIKMALESQDVTKKIETMKQVISMIINGEPMPQLLVTVIRYVQPERDHTLKKLVLYYFEIVEKRLPDGKLIDTLILACNYWMQDLNHPNEFVRGTTLRFLCKIKEPELLEPLMAVIRSCLDHRHSYVKRNAVLCIFSIYKSFDYLIPDAPDIIYKFLEGETDISCKRNAFLMLYNCAQNHAVKYLLTVIDQIGTFGDILQLAVVELVRKVYRTNPESKSQYFRAIFTLLASPSPAVQYEAACTLVTLSSAATAIKAAASAFIDLIVNQSDNNIKLIVLDKLLGLKKEHTRILQDLLMDIMRALASPNLDIRKKTLDIALDLVSPRNIDEVILVLKKELNRTSDDDVDKKLSGEYRQMLVQAIHAVAVKFPDVASSVVHLLMDFICDPNSASAHDVAVFVRDVIHKYENLRNPILQRLCQNFNGISSAKVFRAVLWILGEYSQSSEEISEAFKTIKLSLGEIPFKFSKEEDEKDAKAKDNDDNLSTVSGGTTPSMKSSAARLNADGTYATQTAASETQAAKPAGNVADSLTDKTPFPMRGLLWQGDFFLGASLATTLTKLVLKSQRIIRDPSYRNALSADIMLILVSVLQLGKSSVVPNAIDTDSYNRIMLCLRVLDKPTSFVRTSFLEKTRSAFDELVRDVERRAAESKVEEKKEVEVQADDVLVLRQLRNNQTANSAFEDEEEASINRATGALERQSDASLKLDRMHQLTGLSDPVYAEAHVNVHQYDVTLDVLVVNQRAETLQNLNLELATLGDLKLVERPVNYTLAPNESKMIRANIKVSSTETGIIFGNIVYDVAGASSNDKNCVILNDIHIDIMDYITPAYCTDNQFRAMWAEFEWENKVAINAVTGNVIDFLHHIVATTNMKCLTPDSSLHGECGFLAANLYAKSIFGEDALANVSIEQLPDGKIGGFVRIRSKTQGIALSLGDKITMDQSKKRREGEDRTQPAGSHTVTGGKEGGKGAD